MSKHGVDDLLSPVVVGLEPTLTPQDVRNGDHHILSKHLAFRSSFATEALSYRRQLALHAPSLSRKLKTYHVDVMAKAWQGTSRSHGTGGTRSGPGSPRPRCRIALLAVQLAPVSDTRGRRSPMPPSEATLPSLRAAGLGTQNLRPYYMSLQYSHTHIYCIHICILGGSEQHISTKPSLSRVPLPSKSAA